MLKKVGGLIMASKRVDKREEEDPGIPRVYSTPYFYGRITRDEAEEILAANGMLEGLYLLRESITPMGNFSLTMAHDGKAVHYAIEKRVDGQYMVAESQTFADPVALIEHYHSEKNGFVTTPSIPCCRNADQEAIACRGLSYKALHAHMRSVAREMNANLSRALGPMRETLLMHVLRTMHTDMPWFHGTLSREEAERRLIEDGFSDGKFIVRASPNGQNFALTMCSGGQQRHYFILVNDGETYSIENGQRFKALILLVDHYHNKRDGLPCKLTVPCLAPNVKPAVFKNYMRLMKDLIPKPAVLPSMEEAEKLETTYIDIREDVLHNDLRPEQVTLQGRLGSGQFGDVKKGVCKLSHKTVPVAVKTLKNEDPDRIGEQEILSEANLMKKLDHPNIVRMIGVCKGDSLMLVMELAELGPLKKYLERNRNKMQMWHQVELMVQICDGMSYLESMDVVHRDLAARNVLLMTDHFAKISDFGMSRMVSVNSTYYKALNPGRWPLMWYAPECLYYHKFDSKSDIWSFGVTMWEIVAYGTRPYAGKKPAEILDFIEKGYRLEKPQNCDDRVYEIMLACWTFNKEKRPRFAEIKPKLQQLFKDLQRAQR